VKNCGYPVQETETMNSLYDLIHSVNGFDMLECEKAALKHHGYNICDKCGNVEKDRLMFHYEEEEFYWNTYEVLCEDCT
jgi:hypothetical protein